VARHFAEIILSILLFFLVTDTVRDVQRLSLITRFLIVGGALAALIAIVLYLLPNQTSIDLLSRLRVFNYPEGPGVLRYIRDDPLLPQRATGTAIDPNALGGLLIMMLTLTAPQLFAPRPSFARLDRCGAHRTGAAVISAGFVVGVRMARRVGRAALSQTAGRVAALALVLLPYRRKAT
jgi:hypothetical protein